MLGKLARWFRMLGQDVAYSTELNDSVLLEKAKNENLILLTKDLELYRRSATGGINAFYVEGKTEADQLAELAIRYDLTLAIDMEKSHCPLCNTKLKATPKEELRGELDRNTLKYFEEFWQCPICKQVYWQGAHWKQIKITLNDAQVKLEKLRKKLV